jgi:hypothetical protein
MFYHVLSYEIFNEEKRLFSRIQALWTSREYLLCFLKEVICKIVDESFFSYKYMNV